MTAPEQTLPIDETSRSTLAAAGLRLDVVDHTDGSAHDAWFRAESRGFHSAEPSTALVDQRYGQLRPDHRLVGVWDPLVPDPATPVATTICWPADLTVPGRRTIPAWAVSGVTVAPTHRRRGIARALMEAELRTAVALGLPLAMLTVSESTIYGRFGYGVAALARDVTILTRRARWTGPVAPGRVGFVSADRLLVDGHEIVERVRRETPGQVSYDREGTLWRRQLGLSVDDQNAKNLRFVRYDDSAGAPQGFAIYQLTEDESDFAEHELKLHALVAATDEAYAGLWRYLIEMDLVSKISAHLRPVDEPIRWMVSDFRSVRISETDHLWVRVLDVPAVLGARTYAAAGRLVVRVDDPLGFADGTWALDVAADGTATVTAVDEPADASVTVAALGSLLLGGVRATALGAAGTVTGDAARLDEMFRSPVEPFLSIWF
ncbi:MAG: GNAT family N-acetyltransferase [Aeromicrobium sp.]